jgi:hypothetical protein
LLKEELAEMKELLGKWTSVPAVAALGATLMKSEQEFAKDPTKFLLTKLATMGEERLEVARDGLASNKDTVRIAALAKSIYTDEMEQTLKVAKVISQAMAALGKFVELVFVKSYMGEKTLDRKTYEKHIAEALKETHKAEGRAEAAADAEM